MKRIVVTFVFFVIAFTYSSQLRAQDKLVSYGVKVGASLSNYRLGGALKGPKSKMNTGASLGGFIKYDLSNNFALQSGIDVFYRTSDLASKTDKSSGKPKYFGVEVPLYGIFQVGLGSGKAFIGAGPYAGFGISAKADGEDLYKNNNTTGTAGMNRLNYGIGGIVGYDFNKSWQINASYQLGLSDQYKAQESSMKSQSASIGIVHKFGK